MTSFPTFSNQTCTNAWCRWGLVAAWLLGHNKHVVHVVTTLGSNENKLVWRMFLTMFWELKNIYLPKQPNSELLMSPNPHLSDLNSTYVSICLWLRQTFVVPQGAVLWNATFSCETLLRNSWSQNVLSLFLNWKLPQWLHKRGGDFKQGHGPGPAGKALEGLDFCCSQKNKVHMAQQILLPSSSSKLRFPRAFSASNHVSCIHLLPHLLLPMVGILNP